MPTKQNPQHEAATDSQPGVPASTDQIAHAVHELRNSMNTLLMNAAVLGTGARNVPESVQRGPDAFVRTRREPQALTAFTRPSGFQF